MDINQDQRALPNHPSNAIPVSLGLAKQPSKFYETENEIAGNFLSIFLVFSRTSAKAESDLSSLSCVCVCVDHFWVYPQ